MAQNITIRNKTQETQKTPVLFVCFVVPGLELRALHLEPLYQALFVLGIFEIESHELFAQVHLELQSS
jgi:hypothetical protein